MTVKELIEMLEKIEDKDRLIVVNDKVSDEYKIPSSEVVEQDRLLVITDDGEDLEVDCVVIE